MPALRATRRVAGVAAIGAAAFLASITTGQADDGTPAKASAAAYAQRDSDGNTRGYVAVSGEGSKRGRGTQATASTSGYKGSASASAVVDDVKIFGDLATAKKVTVTARSDSGATRLRGVVRGLVVNGRSLGTVSRPRSVRLGDYGRLHIVRSASGGIVGLRARLTKAYGEYPAGSQVAVGFARAKASDGKAPPPPPPRPEPKKDDDPPKADRPAPDAKAPGAPGGRKKVPRRKGPSRVEALATDRNFVFPVYGKHSVGNGFTGATKGDLGPGCKGPHEGNDIFASDGVPVVAVTDGTLSTIGTKPCSGNRMWLKSEKGDTFFYAHLDSFARDAHNGAKVKAGDVLGFLGSTGQAKTTPPHLHFEIHPGGGLAVDPYPFLKAWETHRDVPPAAWVRQYSQDVGNQPGTLVVVDDYLSR